MDNRLKGYVSKKSGDLFEERINHSCKQYAERGIAFIHKNHEPLRVVSRSSRKGLYLATFTEPAAADYEGIGLCGTIAFEAKYTDTGEMQRKRVTPWQINYLQEFEKYGGKAFVLLGFGENVYRLTIEEWLQAKTLFGRVTLRECDLVDYKVPHNNYMIWFLEGLPEIGTFVKPQSVIKGDDVL